MDNNHILLKPLVFSGGILGYTSDVLTQGDISSILWGDTQVQAGECLWGRRTPVVPRKGDLTE